jgi:hypothetical protein
MLLATGSGLTVARAGKMPGGYLRERVPGIVLLPGGIL